MNRLLPLALLFSLAASPALAEDPRLVTRPYNPDEVVRIDGRAGVQASIAFAAGEHIENVAIGDSASWQVTPNRRANILFVKPLNPVAQTNLTVVTDRRSYFFDLVASPGAQPLYVLRFQYADEPVEAAPAMAALDGQAQGDRPADPASLNFAWESKGKRKLLPSRIFDDGRSTFVSWPAGAPIPALLIRNEKGEEGPVNFAVRDDVIVIDGVPRQIILRSGKDSATIENKREQEGKRPTAAALAAANEGQ